MTASLLVLHNAPYIFGIYIWRCQLQRGLVSLRLSPVPSSNEKAQRTSDDDAQNAAEDKKRDNGAANTDKEAHITRRLRRFVWASKVYPSHIPGPPRFPFNAVSPGPPLELRTRLNGGA